MHLDHRVLAEKLTPKVRCFLIVLFKKQYTDYSVKKQWVYRRVLGKCLGRTQSVVLSLLAHNIRSVTPGHSPPVSCGCGHSTPQEHVCLRSTQEVAGKTGPFSFCQAFRFKTSWNWKVSVFPPLTHL